MSVLRPKYQLNHPQVQGARATIPAEQFTRLTQRRYPYPRVGTRAPDSMFPKTGNPNNPGVMQPMYTTDGYGWVRAPPIGGNPGVLRPHYMLDKAQVQGVMPAATYTRLTSKITTAPELPPRYPVARAPVRVPALEIDWGTVFWGAVAGGLVTLGFVYGVIPALAEWGAAAIRRRY